MGEILRDFEAVLLLNGRGHDERGRVRDEGLLEPPESEKVVDALDEVWGDASERL